MFGSSIIAIQNSGFRVLCSQQYDVRHRLMMSLETLWCPSKPPSFGTVSHSKGYVACRQRARGKDCEFGARCDYMLRCSQIEIWQMSR